MNQEQQKRFLGVKRLASLLDTQFVAPGGFRFGIDALIGLIPVVGDVITVGFSLYILYQSWMIRVPNWVLARMLLNILIETLVDLVPVLGNLFDFFWKANTKNVEILEKYFQRPVQEVAKSKIQLIGLVVFLLATVVTGCLIGVGLIYSLISLVI